MAVREGEVGRLAVIIPRHVVDGIAFHVHPKFGRQMLKGWISPKRKKSDDLVTSLVFLNIR
jgi:hypothetical protein